uniref:UGT59 n=1 Tax=Panax notoginseng TaxID=44586 RepID=A0A977R900_9APIA|nr:UGT59 [Panax notoginseng]
MATQKCFRVLMFPWLAHGHISPFLELARKLIEKGNFFIYFCSTPINLISIKKKLSGDDHQNYTKSIQLVEHNLPTLPQLPPHYHTTDGLPPDLNSTLRKAFEMSKLSFPNTLNTLKPDLLICDDLFQWPEIVASSHDVPVVRFQTCSVTAGSFIAHTFRNPDVTYPFPSIYLHEYEIDQIRRCVDAVFESGKEESGNLLVVNTSKAIEEKYFDYYSLLRGNTKIMPVGPLIQQAPNGDEDMKVIEWLDKKDPCSTVFVSFGSEYFMQKEEVEEMAHGLELSNVNFIWVFRAPVGAEKVKLPLGFVERVGGRGIVMEGWAPQARILGHSSIGGFASHCGWNSVLESINFGVPIIGMPMKFEQPMNARLVSELGVCVEIVGDETRRFGREEVVNVIKKVVGGKIGDDLRRKVKELGATIKEKQEEEMDDVLDELVQICNKKKRIVV